MARSGVHIRTMSNAPQMAEVAALVGDPARANILCALLGGRALTATELAFAAGVTPQTTTGPHVGQMLESIMNVALEGPPRFQPKSHLDDKLRHARTCYDHIAGTLGVGLADRLIEHEHVILGDEAGEVTPAGTEFLGKLGVDLSHARAKRRVFCRPCLDWTERRPHIGGAVGAALASRCFELKWIERLRDGRALTITPAGRRGLMETFALQV
jgi:hypothetical protein